MPKLKTKKSAAKRFKITKKGKVKRQKACRGHLLAKKTRKRKRHLRKSGLVSKAMERTIKRMLAH